MRDYASVIENVLCPTLVYSKHARMALYASDMNEFNQCQTQLKDLHAMDVGASGNVIYRVILSYYLYQVL